MNRKVIVPLIIIFLSCLSLLLLSNQPFFLCLSLVLLAYIKHALYPIKKELLWYAVMCFGGVSIEIALVNWGDAWRYTTQHIFSIPLWMPLFWGTIGTTIIVFYDGLTRN